MQKEDKKSGRKRPSSQITSAEVQSEKESSFENSSIPMEQAEFQKKLFHLICGMMQSLREMSSAKEYKECSKYLLEELNVLLKLS